MQLMTIKQRIIVTIVITLTITCTLFGTGLLLLKNKLEEATFGRMVKEQLEAVIRAPEPQKVMQSPLFMGWQFYMDDTVNSLPNEIRQLPDGSYHSVWIGNRAMHIEVSHDNNNFPLIMMYDITEWEEQEHLLLSVVFIGIVVVFIFGIFMGNWATYPILAPLRKLSHKVKTIQPRQRHIRLANQFQQSEVYPLAKAFDGYLTRIDSFVEREQAFSSAASHELRTPLSVIFGATDILEAQVMTPAGKRALARIQRAGHDMLAFIEATLFLAREDSRSISENTSTDVAIVIEELLDDMSQEIQHHHISLLKQIEPNVIINQPPSIIKITISNLLRNAIEHSQNASIEITMTNYTLQIKDTGKGISEDDLPFVCNAGFTTKSNGNGLGLNLIKRICDRFGWELEISSILNHGTCVTLHFTSPPH